MQKTWKITETLANGYSFESTHRELSNEYRHNAVKTVFKIPCVLNVLWMKEISALDLGLKQSVTDHKDMKTKHKHTFVHQQGS